MSPNHIKTKATLCKARGWICGDAILMLLSAFEWEDGWQRQFTIWLSSVWPPVLPLVPWSFHDFTKRSFPRFCESEMNSIIGFITSLLIINKLTGTWTYASGINWENSWKTRNSFYDCYLLNCNGLFKTIRWSVRSFRSSVRRRYTITIQRSENSYRFDKSASNCKAFFIRIQIIIFCSVPCIMSTYIGKVDTLFGSTMFFFNAMNTTHGICR